jgi:7-cyano-7-deazaguanine synthase
VHGRIKQADYQITKGTMRSVVLFSGGLDSAVLLADEAARDTVQPVYLSAALAWEEAERAVATALIDRLAQRRSIGPLVPLRVDMTDVYAATHWALQGRPPAYDTPDEDVYLPGRNIILVSKAAVYAAAVGASRIVIGTLGHNPFPDATPQFRDAIAHALALGLAHPLTVEAPFAEMTKAEVIRRGATLGVPFEWTLSCMNPPRPAVHSPVPAAATVDAPAAIHCGACSKCRERHDAFRDAGIADPTPYVIPPPR